MQFNELTLNGLRLTRRMARGHRRCLQQWRLHRKAVGSLFFAFTSGAVTIGGLCAAYRSPKVFDTHMDKRQTPLPFKLKSLKTLDRNLVHVR